MLRAAIRPPSTEMQLPVTKAASSEAMNAAIWERAAVKFRRATRPFVFGEGHLRRVLAEYIAYFNQWRPHRSIGQRAPCAPALTALSHQSGTVVATPVLGGLHHVYQIAA